MRTFAFFVVPQLVAAIALPRYHDHSRAAYFLDNNPAGSSIISLKINPRDGTLSDPVRTSTGGKGLYGLSAPGTAVTTDTLFTQDSVVLSQNYLFTVNAGSNTISMFFVEQADPYHPRLLNTVSTLGEFPAAVAYSPRLETVCTINGGAVAGVTCFSVHHTKGLTPLGGLRPIALGQTTPPVGPPGTVSDLVFNPSQTALIAVVKGSPTSPGSIYAYPIDDDDSISTTPVVSRPAELLVDFSISFLGCDSRAVITDPAYGAALVDVSPSFTFTVSKKVVIANEAATCWSLFSSRFNTIFIMDAGAPNITLLDPETGDIKGTLTQSAAGKGSLDAAASQKYLYVLNAGPFVGVSDNSGLRSGESGKEVQSFDLSGLGSRQGFVGMAVYPSSRVGGDEG